MLEYWYKEKRTLVDFRSGSLGPHFDGFAAHLKAKEFSSHWGMEVLGKRRQLDMKVTKISILKPGLGFTQSECVKTKNRVRVGRGC